ncbi:MAG: argininosuccinate synthase [Fimbriimonadaceae bacterium]|nr:MAG: argininosuccinate synthase [Fimbriimonadaceae bacterium]
MKVALAYSGGLDTTWCIPVLRDAGFEVVTVTVDVGGLTLEDLQEAATRSKKLGVKEHVVVEAAEAFFDEIVRYLIAGNVLRGGSYPLCVGAERALQAREVAKIAREAGAQAVAHGCTAAGNDQFRFETALRTLAPELDVLAPVRDKAPSRGDQVALLGRLGLEFPAGKAKYSINSGLWGVTIGGEETTGTERSIPEEAWQRTRGAFESAKPPTNHRVRFHEGVPDALDGRAMSPVRLIGELDALAASYGIGRGIHLGETILGIKGRVAFEAPAATVLVTAHRELEKLTLTKRQQSLKDLVGAFYGEWVHEGLFTEPAARQAEALFRESQRHVTGEVSFELRPGSLFVTGVNSPHSMHAASRAVYGEAAGEWTPEDAKGFARLHGLSGILFSRSEGAS